jgi:hypothetical protein
MLIMALSYTQKTNDTSMIKTYVCNSFTRLSVFADIVCSPWVMHHVYAVLVR